MAAEMTARFDFAVVQDAAELSLLGSDRPILVDRWPAEAPPALRAGVDLAQRLEATGGANSAGATLRIEHGAVARLTVHEASLLNLPPDSEILYRAQPTP